PTLLNIIPFGFVSRTMVNDEAILLLRNAACVEPTAIAIPLSRAIFANFSLICLVHSLPPVIALIYSGWLSVKSLSELSRLISLTSILGIEWCTNRISAESEILASV